MSRRWRWGNGARWANDQPQLLTRGVARIRQGNNCQRNVPELIPLTTIPLTNGLQGNETMVFPDSPAVHSAALEILSGSRQE